MRVLICGGRKFEDEAHLRATLDRLHAEHHFSVVIEGDAAGADRMAGKWADDNGIAHEVFKADWDGLGRKAGPIRNQQMLDEGKPDLVVAFPGTSGTANMCRISEAAGVRVIRIGGFAHG